MPLYVNRPITIQAHEMAGGMRLIALNDRHQIAAEMEVTTHVI
jgi:hypothetical protein